MNVKALITAFCLSIIMFLTFSSLYFEDLLFKDKGIIWIDGMLSCIGLFCWIDITEKISLGKLK